MTDATPHAELELGVDTFGDVTAGGDGHLLSQAQVLRNVIAEGELADTVGIDFFGVGEHHRADFAISSPEVVLAAIAARTKRIRLGSAVTVLGSDDPVKVFQRFSTLDAISNGRAEVILGRGSFIESFPLFGFSLDDYEELFEEKLDLFSKLIENDGSGEPLSWKGASGRVRAPLVNQQVYPPTESRKLKTWIGVGGSEQSVVRAARYGMPLMLAIIGGDPVRFRQFTALYYASLAKFGRPVLPIGVHSPGYIAESDAKAREDYWPCYKGMRDRIGAERGWPPSTRREFDAEVEFGSAYVGSAETVAQKIAATCGALGLARFEMKYSSGTLPHEQMMRSIELYGRSVIPRVRELLAGKV